MQPCRKVLGALVGAGITNDQLHAFGTAPAGRAPLGGVAQVRFMLHHDAVEIQIRMRTVLGPAALRPSSPPEVSGVEAGL